MNTEMPQLEIPAPVLAWTADDSMQSLTLKLFTYAKADGDDEDSDDFAEDDRGPRILKKGKSSRFSSGRSRPAPAPDKYIIAVDDRVVTPLSLIYFDARFTDNLELVAPKFEVTFRNGLFSSLPPATFDNATDAKEYARTEILARLALIAGMLGNVR